MANPYEQFLAPPQSDQQDVTPIGPSGEVLNLPPNTGAGNAYGDIQAPVTNASQNPYAQFLEPDKSKEVSPKETKRENPYAQFLKSSSTPEQSGKVINLAPVDVSTLPPSQRPPIPEISQAKPMGIMEQAGRFMSPLLGPTQAQKFEEAVPVVPELSEQANVANALAGVVPPNAEYQYKPYASRLEREQGIFTPFAPIEKYQPSESDSGLEATGKAVFNTAAGLEESFLSPGGMMLPGLGGIGGRIVSGLFSGQMLSAIPEQYHQMMNGKTTQEQIEGGLGMLSSFGFGVAAGAHAILPNKAPLNASKNPLVNEKEAKVTADADTQATAPLTPDQEKINQQWGELKKQAADVANQLGNLPEDHPDRPALREKAQKIANQMQQLRAGNPIELEIPVEELKGDERFMPPAPETPAPETPSPEKPAEALKEAQPELPGLEQQANDARDRIAQRRKEGRLNMGLDPEDLADHAIIGADYIRKGLTKFGDWSKKMLSDLGNYVRPFLNKIWDAAKKAIKAYSTGGGTFTKEGSEVGSAGVSKGLKKTRNTIVNTFKRAPAKEAISYMRDAGDNAANIYAKENTNEVKNDLKREFKKKSDKASEALSFVIESKKDPKELDVMRQKINASPDASPVWKKKALDAIDFAESNYARLEPIADKYEQIGLTQVAEENANGIDTPVREGYVPHYQDLEEQELFGGAGAGSATGFRKMRVHDTFADSIAAGIDPKSLNATDLLQKRLASGQKSINYRSWIDSLKGTIDPASGDPIATKVSIVKRPDGSTYLDVPKGYHQETLAGQRVAIKNGYEGIISALNDPSAWSKSMAGQIIQKTAGTSKSLTLGLDTYHLGRIAIWNSLIKSLGIKTFQLPIPSYSKGQTILDHSTAELQRMIANGEVPKKWAIGLIENKRLLNIAIKTGYNVGNIMDTLHQDWIHNIPGLGTFNNWLFNNFQRGAMAESWLIEFQRYRNAYPGKSEEEVARMVSKDLNTRYGNLGRQGFIKSKTMQDTARFLFLAPQWNEGLIRTELGAMGQAGQALLDAATGKRLFAGILARSVGGMMAAQFIANQLINYATRGTPTWENPEEGIGAKLSAWIPDLWGGPGFFLNPMSLAMETTHLLVKGYERSGESLKTSLDYLRSRSSVPMRPVWDFVTRKNYMGTPYAPGQLWKGMLADSVPIPIAGGTIYSAAKEGISGEPSQQYAGQYQKQLFSTFGVKLEQAPSDESRVYTLANHFKLDNNIQDRAAGYNSPYSELNHALVMGNMENAKNAMTNILETRTPAQIEKYYKQTYPSMRLLESNKQQKDFLESLNEEQRSVYDRAKEKRKDTATSALDLLRDLK